MYEKGSKIDQNVNKNTVTFLSQDNSPASTSNNFHWESGIEMEIDSGNQHEDNEQISDDSKDGLQHMPSSFQKTKPRDSLELMLSKDKYNNFPKPNATLNPAAHNITNLDETYKNDAFTIDDEKATQSYLNPEPADILDRMKRVQEVKRAFLDIPVKPDKVSKIDENRAAGRHLWEKIKRKARGYKGNKRVISPSSSTQNVAVNESPNKKFNIDDSTIGTKSQHFKHNKERPNKMSITELKYKEETDKWIFKRVTLSFQHITYVIPEQRIRCWTTLKPAKIILDHVSGIFPPGVNAIMGPSGGGKTSLLTVLGGRKYMKKLNGMILLNGEPCTKDFINETGFVTQEDVLMGTLTVRENIMFSASLRLPQKTPLRKRKYLVQRVIDALNLGKCADSKVGTELIRGISGGEKKRTNIGVELVTIPSLLFLDEPTSGLDAATAITVIRLLTRLADRGCNIIMSIHQPRYEIFKMFDTLILLSAGLVVFHGPSTLSLPYFSSLGFNCELHNNPADFFLDMIGKTTKKLQQKEEGDDDIPAVDLAECYRESVMHSKVMSELYEIRENNPQKFKRDSSLKHMDKGTESYPVSFCRQLAVVSKRTSTNIARNLQPVLVQSMSVIIYSLIVGTIYFRVSDTAQYGIQNRAGALFFIVMNQVFGNLSAIDVFMKERALYVHETTNGFYRVSVYFLTKVFCDMVPMRFWPATLLSFIAYWMIGLRPYASNYFVFLLALLFLTTAASSIVLLASVSFKTTGVATNICGLIFIFMIVFGGLFVNIESISPKIRWFKYFSIFRYAYNILLINEVKDAKYCDNTVLNSPGNATTNCVFGNDHLAKQGIPYETRWDLWKNYVALLCIILAFWTLAYTNLRKLKKHPK